MFNEHELPWIEAGYTLFALKGPDALKIELLAREVGISKSSFYHHFADLDIFRELMMNWHLSRGKAIADAVNHCKTFDPDFLMLMVANKEDLLFNRQLRIHRDNLSYQLSYERAHSLVENEIIYLWADYIGLSDNKHIARNIFKVVTDLFYQRLTAESLSYDWMVKFLDEVQTFMNDVIRSSGVMSQLR